MSTAASQAQEDAARQDDGFACPGALHPAGIGRGGGGIQHLPPVILVQAPALGDGEEGPEARAELMGLDRAYISGLEQGRRNPTAVTLWRIAVALEIRPADLLKPPTVAARSRQGKA